MQCRNNEAPCLHLVAVGIINGEYAVERIADSVLTHSDVEAMPAGEVRRTVVAVDLPYAPVLIISDIHAL